MSSASLSPPEPFGAIIFDCDGTLVDTAAVYLRAYNAALAPHGAEMRADWYFERIGLSAEALLETFAREHGGELVPAELMEPIAEAYLENLDDLEVIEAVARVARRYHGVLPMAVASAGKPEIVEATLEATALRALFGVVVTVDDVGGRTKPAPDLFLEAAHRLGVDPSECTVFEDSDEGLEAARRAGMTATDVREHAHR